MGRSQESFSKREKEKKRLKKRQEKAAKKAARKEQPKRTEEEMFAYVDEYGQITDTPPDPTKREEVKLEDIEIGVPKREKEEDPKVKQGRVDFFDHNKGFGFIKQDKTQERFFVHISACEDDIIEGNQVSFELEQGLKGMNAVRVKKI